MNQDIYITKRAVYEALLSAIETYQGDTGPGAWGAEDEAESGGHPAYINITYTVRNTRETPGLAESVSNQDTAVFLEQWGGDAILASANLMLDPEQQATFGSLDEVDGAAEYIFTARVTLRAETSR
jgi:hypothetical protein